MKRARTVPGDDWCYLVLELVPLQKRSDRITFLAQSARSAAASARPAARGGGANILEVARWSGSAGNRQPWEFVVVRDRDMLRQLSMIDGANAGHLATAAVGIAIVIHPEVPDLDAYDEGRLAERILLAAAAQDLGAAIGHFTGPGDTWAASAEAKRLLGVPERMVLRETISIGYPAEHLERTPNPPGRKPREQLVHWDHY